MYRITVISALDALILYASSADAPALSYAALCSSP